MPALQDMREIFATRNCGACIACSLQITAGSVVYQGGEMIISMNFPPASLFPNRRNGAHWTTTKAAKDEARESAVEATKRAMRGTWDGIGTIPLSIVFVAPDGRHRDLDNCLAAAKAQIDGMADAMGVNDKRFRPILIDYVKGDAPGAMIVAVGVQIVSSQVIA